MRDGHDDGGSPPPPSGARGLSSCAKCQGIFPAARLTNVEGGPLCGDCNRKFGPVDSQGRTSSTGDAGRPSYKARMVTSSITGDAARPEQSPLDPSDPRQLMGRFQPRGQSQLPPPVPPGLSAPPPVPAAPAPPGFGAPAAAVAGAPATAVAVGAPAGARASQVAAGQFEPARVAAPPPLAYRQDANSSAIPPWAAQGAPPADGSAPPPPPPRPASDPLMSPARPVLSKSKFPQWQGGSPVRNAGIAPAPPAPSVASQSGHTSSSGTGDSPRASQPAAPRIAQFGGDVRRASQDGGVDRFEAYAELRQRIDGGEDTLDIRRRAAEMATRLALHFEAVEHYKRCCELAPDDEGLRLRLDNVQRSVGADRGGAPPPPELARKVAEEARPFWEDLGDAISYPLRGAGLPVLLVGGCLFGVGQVIGTINMFAWSVSAMLWGYIAAYLFDVINTTAAGKNDPPGLPEASNLLESYIFPLFAYAVCGIVSFVPFMSVAWLAGKGWLPAPVAVVLMLATFALGFFVFPMTLMVRAMFQSISDAANPAIVLSAIGRILPDYIAMFIATCILWIAFGVVYSVAWFLCYVTLGAPSADAVLTLDMVRVAAWVLFTILTWPVFLYAWMLQGHLLGRLYRQSLRRLGWFAPPTEQQRSARKLSAALGVAAVCALVALSGAVYGGFKVLERYKASPNAGSFGLQCPLVNGSKLTYYWENTDGPAGLTEYTFSTDPGGRMIRVTASTKIAGHPGEGGVESVGTFDPDTGVFTEAAQAWGDGVHYDGKTGLHVPFFGPKRASLGSTYMNDWAIRSSERWQGTWACWKVHQEPSTRDLYFDTKSGVLVGSSFGGIGFRVTAWLTAVENVPGVTAGPPPGRDFSEHAPAEEAPGLDFPPERPMPLPPGMRR